MEEADRDRLDPFALQKPHRALDARFVERPVDPALGIDPLVDFDLRRRRSTSGGGLVHDMS